jgi:ABC-type branched-subunit amino acid transport system substrate-binding protein
MIPEPTSTPVVYAPYPTWPKVVAAFVAGAVLSAFCIVQVAPPPTDGKAQLTAGAGPEYVVVGEDGSVVEEGVAADAVAGDAAAAAGGTRSTVKGAAATAGSVRRTVTGKGPTGGAAGTAGTEGSQGRQQGGSGAGGTTTGGGAGGSGGTSTGGGAGDGTLECKAGRNGGVTDDGVTATEIKIAATVVRDGPGESLLGSSEIGMKAVVNKVNAAGGICGRRLTLTLVNDSWDAAAGRDTIKRFIDEKQFALPVVPSSEGLSEAIRTNLIKDAGIPVVGANGLRIDQYSDPTTYPVGAATVSIMRAMVRRAYDEGARTFGIVWDQKYKFGQEGADAFKSYVRSLDGASIKADQPLEPTDLAYGTPAQAFNRDCENTEQSSGCDLVVLLLVPDVALKWKSSNQGRFAGRGEKTYGAQTLFTDDFAKKCAGWCAGMSVWTGYNPAIPPLDSKPGVGAYVNDVRALSPSVDFRNQFLQGAYLGMQVFVDAVKACSPRLTRACVNSRLDATPFETDLASTLQWAPGKHHANKKAQAFRIDAAGGSFNNWQYEDPPGFVQDPSL